MRAASRGIHPTQRSLALQATKLETHKFESLRVDSHATARAYYDDGHQIKLHEPIRGMQPDLTSEYHVTSMCPRRRRDAKQVSNASTASRRPLVFKLVQMEQTAQWNKQSRVGA